MFEAIAEINWKQILIGDEKWTFLLEIFLRTVFMILLIIAALKILDKRGVKQLSIFELVVIISFGSAAGDPMIYKEIGILTSALVFTVIIAIYRLITYMIGKNEGFEKLMEGKPICLIQEGRFSIDNFRRELLGTQELFSELRLKGVSQLGQIHFAIEELSGEISVFFYPDDEVRYGLPIMPATLAIANKKINVKGPHSCYHCGFTEEKVAGRSDICAVCGETAWVPSSNNTRIT